MPKKVKKLWKMHSKYGIIYKVNITLYEEIINDF